MDQISRISEDKKSISILAVDGLFYGLLSGILMFIVLAGLVWVTGDSPGTLLGKFSADGSTSPIQGFFSHLAVSAIYGVLFGVLIWPIVIKLPSAKPIGLFAGLLYGVFLLLLAQTAILPGTNSPLGQIAFWQWALGHAVYGLVLGGLFARKIV